MKEIKTETLIIGAGPAGLSCAMELSKADKDFIVVEKDSMPGGLSKTYVFKEDDGSVFYTDNGPHRFFSKNKNLYDFIENLISEDWIKVKRQTRQYIDGVFYDYPVNAFQALRNIGFLGSIKMGADYFFAKIKYGLFKRPINTFQDYAYANFGKSLADFNIVNYTEKIWGIPSDQIHPDWAIQRIKGLNLLSVFMGAFRKILSIKNDGPKSLVEEFFYPSKGTGLIYETIVKKIESKGYTVYFETEPVKIDFLKNGEILVWLKNKKGEELKIICTNLVESIPITNFVKLIEPKPETEIIEAVSKLRHRNQVYLFVTLNKESITGDQWIYFPSKETSIARVSEMRNFSKFMSPEGKTSLFVEFFCFEGDSVWNSSKEELLEEVLRVMGGVFFDKKDIRETYVIRQKNVYPVYDMNYLTYLDKVKNYLNEYKNLFYIGRPGRFRYNNQDHSLEMGMLTAKSIIDSKKYDIESVGQEKEYYEEGKLFSKK
ncbi:MAG: NAD-dependent amino-oxidase [Patescibacteria group bacterium]|nr:NAD-dependent amino-oxidase [Patescibacteria group bacterium]